MTCEQARLAFGVYLLGVIDPAERAEVDRHLETCRDCRDEFDRLAPIPPLLDTLRPAEVERLRSAPTYPEAPVAVAEVPPAILFDRMLVTALRRRRRGRRLAALAAAAVLILVAGLSVIMVRSVPGPAPARAVNWTAIDPGSGLRAEASLAATAWGTAITVRLSGVAVGTECTMIARSRSGRSQPVGAWRADYSGAAEVTVATSFSLTELESLLITNRSGEPLLRLHQ